MWLQYIYLVNSLPHILVCKATYECIKSDYVYTSVISTNNIKCPSFHLYQYNKNLITKICKCFLCHFQLCTNLKCVLMPPTLKKLKGHIAFDLSACPSLPYKFKKGFGNFIDGLSEN